MLKAASFHVLQGMNIQEKNEDYVKDMMTKKYEELDNDQRTFYTIVLILAEIERQATEHKQYIEKEILEPGDKGYVEPTPKKD